MSDPTASAGSGPTPSPGPVGARATTGTPGAAGAPGGTDWTDQVTDLIVDSVDKVRSRTTGPILDAAHAGVHLVVALVIVLPVFVLLTLGAVRLLDWVLPAVWMAYALLAAVNLAAGAFLWSRRRPVGSAPGPSGTR